MLIPILIPVLMSAIALVVVLIREGQFQQLSALLEARLAEIRALRSEVAAATASAQSTSQHLSETQRRLAAAETAGQILHEKLGALSFQLGQERIKREAADKTVQELTAHTQGLERQCRELSASNQKNEARAAQAEAEVAELQYRVAQSLQELQQLRLVPHDGKENAVRAAAAAAQVARVERAIHAQTEELMTALAALRRETEGFSEATTPVQDDSAEQQMVASGDEAEPTRDLIPYSIPRLTWAKPEQPAELQIEAIAS